ncbi:polysaccharide deacetylase family protein, partial [Candidatus Sumerlaeota bacterium]|nr:polysaccharide deacetylase family protein [Candidatus Sumerlaeota bacterium]
MGFRTMRVATCLAVCIALAAGGFAAPSRTKAAKTRQRAANPSSSSLDNPSNNNVSNQVIRRGDQESSMVALTFDDAPVADTLPSLLALLRAENVKATFFLTGKNVELYPQLARTIVADGHEAGNHSYSHRDLHRASAEVAEKEIAGTQKLIHDVVGTTSTYFRPPFGNVSDEVKRICQREGISIICWNVDPADWRKDTTRDS